MARYLLIVLALVSMLFHAWAGDRPRIVRTVLKGPHASQGVATEVVPPPGWQAGQPVPARRETTRSSWESGTALPFPSKLAALPSLSVEPSSLPTQPVRSASAASVKVTGLG